MLASSWTTPLSTVCEQQSVGILANQIYSVFNKGEFAAGVRKS